MSRAVCLPLYFTIIQPHNPFWLMLYHVLSVRNPCLSHNFQCNILVTSSCRHTLYRVCASLGHSLTICAVVSWDSLHIRHNGIACSFLTCRRQLVTDAWSCAAITVLSNSLFSAPFLNQSHLRSPVLRYPLFCETVRVVLYWGLLQYAPPALLVCPFHSFPPSVSPP